MQLTTTNRTWFANQVIQFAQDFGRFHLPWKNPATPYRVWISEVMLQQTQVQSVLGYFDRFMERFPTVESLAQSHIDQVLSLWSGLGYYRRAHHLHQTAQIIMQKFHGRFPDNINSLLTLPGIGRSTAGAILAQGFNSPAPILEANVKRLLMRFFCINGNKTSPTVVKKLWELSTSLTPKQRVALYTQGIMDLGATICTKSQPKCALCPLQLQCLSLRYNKQDSIPERIPKKIKPVRFCLFLVNLNPKNEVYLLKRPDHGIWSGLWCLPILPYIQQVNKLTKLLKGSNYVLGNRSKHTFTHFDLVYKPVMIRNHKLIKSKNKQYRWVTLEQLADFGMPSAIKYILKGQDFEQFKHGLLPQA